MAEKIDVDKLKNDAFMAIDALFGDEDETETASLDQNSDQPGDFDPLEEYILALDWEYSDKDITAFINQLDTISEKYTDRYSQALAKLIKSIANYLYKAKDKAFPETLNIMAHVVKSLVKVNTSKLDKIAAKAEVSAAYRKVSALKRKIEQYNAEFGFQQTDASPETGSSAGSEETEPREAEPEETGIQETQDIEVVSSPEPVQPEQEEDADTDMEEFVSSLSEPVAEPEPDPFADTSETWIDSETKKPFDAYPDMDQKHILDKLAEFENRIEYLEHQNKQLKQIIAQGYNNSESTLESSDLTFEEPEDESSELEFETPAPEVESLTADDIQYEDEFSWEVDAPEEEIIEGETIIDDGDLMEEPDDTPLFSPEEAFPSSETEEEPEFPETEKEEYVEYVRFFQMNDQTVALPNNYINNVYKLPSKLSKTIHETESVTLGDLASISRKLSKNMKGSLQGMPSKELKTLTADVLLLTGEETKYNFGVLCSCDETYVMIPVSDQSKSNLTLITEIEKSDNEYSQYSAEVEGIGTTPLIFPC